VNVPFTHALLRSPGENLASGLTRAGEGPPDFARALEQHERYCSGLADAGLSLTILPADPQHPDGCFVEDTALVTARGAVLMRPGAPSRRGEVGVIAAALEGLFGELAQVQSPHTVDAGDVCDADGHFLIGVSSRTDPGGAQALARLLGDFGYQCSIVDIRGSRELLHLKSGLAYLGDGCMLVTSSVPRIAALRGYALIDVPDEERYAANALRVNDRVLIAAGYPRTRRLIEDLGLDALPLEMSEFRKLDGGLSCLSLRW
jgi:dimethylargininase